MVKYDPETEDRNMALTNAEKQKAFRERMKKAGYVLKRVWVKKYCTEQTTDCTNCEKRRDNDHDCRNKKIETEIE
jgi:hypothetical protein